MMVPMSRITITPHAKRRRKQMRVTEDQIWAVVDDPEMTYPDDPKYPNERWIYQRGPLVVVVEHGKFGTRVMTVFWHGKDER
jgi:hypothetical protein